MFNSMYVVVSLQVYRCILCFYKALRNWRYVAPLEPFPSYANARIEPYKNTKKEQKIALVKVQAKLLIVYLLVPFVGVNG